MLTIISNPVFTGNKNFIGNWYYELIITLMLTSVYTKKLSTMLNPEYLFFAIT